MLKSFQYDNKLRYLAENTWVNTDLALARHSFTNPFF
jgi:hypothetical protein